MHHVPLESVFDTLRMYQQVATALSLFLVMAVAFIAAEWIWWRRRAAR